MIDRSDPCYAGFLGGGDYGICDGAGNAHIEGGGNNVGFGKLPVGNEGGEGAGGCDLHFIVDGGGTAIERTAEDTGECENVVDLVREIRSSRADDSCTGLERELGHNFGGGICHREDYRIGCHTFYHFGGNYAGGADADKDVCTAHCIGEVALFAFAVCPFCYFSLGGVIIGVAVVDDAVAVDHSEVAKSHIEKVSSYGDTRGTRAVDDSVNLGDILLYNLEGVEKSGGNHYCGAVLIVVEYGDIADLLKSALDLEAARCADVLKIYTAKGAREQINRADDLIYVLASDAEGEGIDVGKALEEGAFSLHYGHTRLRADVTEAENGSTVGYDCNDVMAAGKLVGFGYILLNFKTRGGNTGGIGEGEILATFDGSAGDDLDLPSPFVVLFK